MKKVLLVIIVIIALFWVGVLVFIPSPLQVSAVAASKTPPTKMNSLLRTTNGLEKWWPAHSSSPTFRNYAYSVLSETPLGVRLLAKDGADTFSSEMIVLPASPDSSIVQWKAALPASLNPFTRIQQYNKATSIKNDFQLLLDSLIAYATNRSNLYGMDIQVGNFTNPFMLSTQAQFKSYPTTNEVYAVIGKMRSYAQANDAAAVDSPMVNIEWMDNGYLLRTALPINKKLPTTDAIGFKQMVLGKTLIATTTGGRSTVEQSLLHMQDFISDYRLTSPAIPFQLWTTNRLQQPDTSKWVTRLYYPIF